MMDRPMNQYTRLALEGVRIIALEQFGAGPYATLHLADLGADVIKIEHAQMGGDVGRSVPPYAEDGDSLFFEAFNRGKRSVSIDIATDSGRAVFEDLVRVSQAVFSNLRGDVPAKIGITYEDLKHLNPKIVCCSLSGFGMTGPRRSEPGYDYVMQALAGWMDITGEPTGPPTKSGLSVVDLSAGFVAALALVSGLHAADRDSMGGDCDVSLFDTAVSMLTYPGVWHLNAAYAPRRMPSSAHPSIVPFQAFEAKDGWIVIACPKEKFWKRLTEVLGRPDLALDPRYASFADRHRNREELLGLLQDLIRQRTVAELLDPLRAAGVPSAPVNTVEDALLDPQVEARGLVLEADHPRYRTIRTLASPVRVGPAPDVVRRAPRRGEDTDAVVRNLLGYDEAMIAQARAGGAFGNDDQASEPDRPSPPAAWNL
jgi:crotonobetainyl-CoA:carnitine CoA-transferase CaiB-like acyl-CoA transferase